MNVTAIAITIALMLVGVPVIASMITGLLGAGVWNLLRDRAQILPDDEPS